MPSGSTSPAAVKGMPTMSAIRRTRSAGSGRRFSTSSVEPAASTIASSSGPRRDRNPDRRPHGRRQRTDESVHAARREGDGQRAVRQRQALRDPQHCVARAGAQRAGRNSPAHPQYPLEDGDEGDRLGQRAQDRSRRARGRWPADARTARWRRWTARRTASPSDSARLVGARGSARKKASAMPSATSAVTSAALMSSMSLRRRRARPAAPRQRGAYHAIAGDERRQRLLAHPLGAGRAAGYDEIAQVGGAVVHPQFDVARQRSAELRQHGARLAHDPGAVVRATCTNPATRRAARPDSTSTAYIR